MSSNNQLDLLSGARVYLVSNIALAMIPFILLPILTRSLGPESYGKLAMFQVLITGLAAFVGLGVNGSYQRKFFDHHQERSELALFLGSCIQTLACSSLLVAIVILLMERYLVSLVGLEIEWILIAVGVIFFTTLINLRLTHWQVNGHAKTYGLVQFAQALLNMLLSIALVVFLLYGFEGRLSAQIIAPACIAFLCIVSFKREGLVKLYTWRRDYLVEILKFGVPLIPHTFGAFLIASADRFFINENLGLKEVGVYMVAVQLSVSLNIGFDAVNKAFVPWLYGKLKENDPSEMLSIVVKTYLWFLIILVCGGFGSWLFAPTLTVLIAGQEFTEAGEVIGWLIMGQVLGGMYLMVTNYIFYMKRTDLLGFVTISSGVINLGMLYYMIPMWGLKGAAISFLAAMVVRFLLTWFVAFRVCPMPWFNFKKLHRVKLI